jgi:DNA-binding NarL/FixJ family response regulator
MLYSFFSDSAEQMLECGADDYISKDASAMEVRDALRRLYLKK